MNEKTNNEITVKVTCSKDQLINFLKEKGFKLGRVFTMDDYYFIPNNLDINNLTTRDIISKCIIIRNILDDKVYKKILTFKIKNIDNNGDILNQKSINCDIYDIEQAKAFLKAIGYIQVMNIKEDDMVYYKNNFELAIKNIKNGDILIEIETDPNSDFDTIEKLKNAVIDLKIPVLENEFFIKKAEIELNKVLGRNENT